MRILHIRNIANVANVLATKQTELGHKAVTLEILNKPQVYRSDFNIGLSVEYGFSDVPKRFYLLIKNLLKNMDFDVFHLHDGGLFPFDIDVPSWFKVMGKVCVHWHGSKLRNMGNSGLSKCADYIFVSTPDLLRFEDRAEWIPNPIDLQALPHPDSRDFEKSNNINIIHAPSRRNVKGTDGIIAAVNTLKSEGYNVVLKLMENKTHDEVMRTMLNSDIVIDQISPTIGAYGVVSIEGMALEKPVICSLKEEYLMDFYHGCPIINADFSHLNEKLRYMVEDESARRAFGKNGRVYVERMHDALEVTKLVLTVYG
jgi:glycosyltransferase involved in cell wall biosynthesis